MHLVNLECIFNSSWVGRKVKAPAAVVKPDTDCNISLRAVLCGSPEGGMSKANEAASATDWRDMGNAVNKSHSAGFCVGMLIGAGVCSKKP